jgi:hypothetical protein
MAAQSKGADAAMAGLAAAAGGLFAVFADLFQKGEASAVFNLTGAANRLGHGFYPARWGAWPDLPVIATGLALLCFAVFLAILAKARSRNSGFYTGAGALAVLLTCIPYDAPLPAPSGTTVSKLAAGWSPPAAALIPARYEAGGAPPVILAAAGDPLPVTLVVHIPMAAGKTSTTPPRIDGHIFDAVSRREWQIGYVDPSPTTRMSGGEVTYRFDFVIEPGPPHGATMADLRLRVHAPGYRTVEAAQGVSDTGLPVTIDVTLKPSALPRTLQGLARVLERPSF